MAVSYRTIIETTFVFQQFIKCSTELETARIHLETIQNLSSFGRFSDECMDALRERPSTIASLGVDCGPITHKIDAAEKSGVKAKIESLFTATITAVVKEIEDKKAAESKAGAKKDTLIKDLIKYKPKDYVQLEVAAQIKALKGKGKGKGKGEQIKFDYSSIGEEMGKAVAANVVTYTDVPGAKEADELRRHKIISDHMSVVPPKNGKSPVGTGAESRKTGRGTQSSNKGSKSSGKGKSKEKGKEKGKGKGKSKGPEAKAKGKKSEGKDWWTGRGSSSQHKGKGKGSEGKKGKA